jgi:hypothetical protein
MNTALAAAITVLSTLAMSCAAHADGLRVDAEPAYTVGAHIYTKHPRPGIAGADSAWAGQSKLWNDRTVGVYVARTIGGPLRAVAGGYCNSFSRTERNVWVGPNGALHFATEQQKSCNVTKYVGLMLERNLIGDLRASVTLTVLHGYNGNMHNATVGGARLYVAPIPSIALGPVRLSIVGSNEYHLSAESRF